MNINNKFNIGVFIESLGVYLFLIGYDNLKLLCESKDKNVIDDIVKKLKMDRYIYKKVKIYFLGMK